ncbi:tRNA uridine 5-carboxymethylaminomethyl modification enzyme MnmG, partial [Striga asiatica]
MRRLPSTGASLSLQLRHQPLGLRRDEIDSMTTTSTPSHRPRTYLENHRQILAFLSGSPSSVPHTPKQTHTQLRNRRDRQQLWATLVDGTEEATDLFQFSEAMPVQMIQWLDTATASGSE